LTVGSRFGRDHHVSSCDVSDQDVFVEGAELAHRTGDLDFQNPEPRGRAIREVTQVARLVNGVWKIADSMAPDVQIEPPSSRAGLFGGVCVQRLSTKSGNRL
jgi:hypothetical protein